MMLKLRLFLREYWPYILAAILFLLLVGRPVNAQVQLPIEVYAPDGRSAHVESVTVDVGPNPTALCFRAHQAGYHMSEFMYQNGWDTRDDAASVSVGGSPFISNWNSTAAYVEAQPFGGVGGGFHTVWTCIPASAFGGQLSEGTRTIAFRFAGTHGKRSGYRIVDMDIRSGGTTPQTGTSVLQTQLVLADPTSWPIPVGGNVENGRITFTSRDIVDLDNTPLHPEISCASCHISNGYDLSYFGYSDKVIQSRARSHGLTEQEALDIAAYVRSLNAENPYARPYNPVFQPGPGLQDRGAEYWSAGAGLDAVLPNDDAMAQYIFPDQSPEGMRSVLDIGTWDSPTGFGNIINIQELPISIQFPDWNNWLPDIHPFTGYGYADVTSHSLWNSLQELETAYDTPAQVEQTINQDRSTLICTQSCGASGFADLLRFSFGFGNELENSIDIVWSESPADHYIARLSLMQLMGVKMWGEMQQNDLFDLGERLTDGLVAPSVWRGAGDPIRLVGSPVGDQDPHFFWPGVSNVVYGSAPHINGRCDTSICLDGAYDNAGAYGPPGIRMIEGYMSALWYDVQQVIGQENIGWPGNNGGAPVDHNYTTEHNNGIQNHTGISQYWRLFTRRVHATQQRNNIYTQATTEYQYAFNSGAGFTATNANFWEVIGRDVNSGNYNRYAADIPLTHRAMEAYWDEWAEFARSVPIDWWVREDEPTGMYESPDAIPLAPEGGHYFDSYTDATNAYRLAYLMRNWGLDSLTIDNWARWGESMWSGGNFEQFFSNGTPPPPPPPPGNQPPVVQITFPTSGSTVGKRYTITATAIDPDNNVSAVNFYGRTPRDNDFVFWCSDNAPPYECLRNVNRNGQGLTTARVEAIDFLGLSDVEEVTYTTSTSRAVSSDLQVYKLAEPSTGAVYDILGRRVISFQDADHIVTEGLSNGTYLIVTETERIWLTVSR